MSLSIIGKYCFASQESNSEYDLPVIIREGESFSNTDEIDDLQYESEKNLIPSQKGKTRPISSSGSMIRDIQNQLPLPVTDSSNPGGTSQVSGFGMSSEDIDVQAFGISLNSAQGYGFNFSTFPQYFWSGYEFGLSSNHMTAVSGQLELIPWTYESLRSQEKKIQAMGFASSLGMNQISVAASDGKNYGVLAGYSQGKSMGPGLQVSTRWKKNYYFGSAYFLGADTKSESPGTSQYPSPYAKINNSRWIPILKNGIQINADHQIETLLFYDSSQLIYQSDSRIHLSSNDSKLKANQWGLNLFYTFKNFEWKFYHKEITYEATGFMPVEKSQKNIQTNIGYHLYLGDFELKPVLQGLWVSDFEVYPEGSLEAKLGKNNSVFAQGKFSRRIPSLSDQYGQFKIFQGNPSLKTETDWTGIVGFELKRHYMEGSLQAYSQFRKNAHVYMYNEKTTISNRGNAEVFALISKIKFILGSWIDIYQNSTVTRSRLHETGASFPNLPSLISTLGVSVHSQSLPKKWEWSGYVRAWTQRSSYYYTLPGFVSWDNSLTYKIFKNVTAEAKIENIFNQIYQLSPGYSLGRTVSISLTGII